MPAIDNPTRETVASFVSILKHRFPGKVIEAAPIVTFESELAELRQKPDETLTSYHSQALDMMYKYGAKDRTTATEALTLAESSVLDTFLRGGICGIIDPSVERKWTKYVGAHDRSLRMLYEVAESTRGINLEVQKLFEDETKDSEPQFYKETAERNMPKT